MDLSKNNNYIEYQYNLEKQVKQDNLLNNNVNQLKKNNYEIKSLIKEFQTLNSAYNDEKLIVTSNYYNYIVLFFVSILLFFLFIRFSEKQSGGGKMKIKNIFNFT
jgi:ATP-dependent Zn protease